MQVEKELSPQISCGDCDCPELFCRIRGSFEIIAYVPLWSYSSQPNTMPICLAHLLRLLPRLTHTHRVGDETFSIDYQCDALPTINEIMTLKI